MFGRKPAEGAGGGSSANAQSTPPAKKGFAAGLFGTSATPRSAPGASKPAPRTPQAELRDDDLPGMFTRATTLLENIQRRVSASSGARGASGTPDDADNARQFMRVNEVKRLTTRMRAGVATLADAGEKGAWEAQLAFLESETATAVEAVLTAASPAPAVVRPPETRNETTTREAGDMFTGLDVSPAPPPPPTTTTTTPSPGIRASPGMPPPPSPKPASAVVSPSPKPVPAPESASASVALGGGGLGLFSGLDVSPAPRPASPETRASPGTPPPPPPPPASPGISLEPPPPPLDASAFSTPATTVPSEAPAATAPAETERGANDTAAPVSFPSEEKGPSRRRPRVRVGYARDDDARETAEIAASLDPTPEKGGDGSRPVSTPEAESAEAAAARAESDAARDAEAERRENLETKQKADVVRKWKAAVVIQSHYRGRRTRAAVSKMLAAMAAATAAAAKEDLERAARASRAATRIQAAHRARSARAEVQKMRSAAQAAAAAVLAAEAEIRAAEAAEAAAAAEQEAAAAEAAEHRAREAAASQIQAALRGRFARLEVSRRRVAAAAARDAAARAAFEEQRAREAAATRIQSASRAKAARAEFERRRNAARLAALHRDEKKYDDTARKAARDAAADLGFERTGHQTGHQTGQTGHAGHADGAREDHEGEDEEEACSPSKETSLVNESGRVGTEKKTADETKNATDAEKKDGKIFLLDAEATLGVAAAAAAATEVLDLARRSSSLTSSEAVEAFASALDRAAAAVANAAREARRCVGAPQPVPPQEPRGFAPPSFDLISF